MSIEVQRRRGTTAEHSTFTGAVGEITVDTDKDTVVVHDGITLGGHALPGPKDGIIKGTSGKNYRLLSGVIRNTGSGWFFIDDSGHAPTGFTGVVTNANGTITLQHDVDAGKVSTLLITPDETLARLGLIAGASVGFDTSTVTLAGPLSFFVDSQTGAVTAPAHFGSKVSAVVGSGSCAITHPSAYTGDAPQITPVGTAGGQPRFTATFGGNSTTILAMGDIGGYVSYNGSAWTYSGEMVSPPTFSFSGGTLTVTHPEALGFFGGVSSRGALLCNYDSVADTFFEIEFRDYAGALVTTETTDMKAFFSRPASVRHNKLRGIFAVNRSVVFVDANDVVNAGGNFWIIGLMEV